MRILLAQNSLYYPAHGGGDKSNRLLMEALAARGHACRAVARATPIDADAGGVARFERHGVEVHTVASHLHLRGYLAAAIADFRPEAILASTDDPAQLLLETALKSESARVVYLARATLALPFGPDCAFPSEARTATLRRACAAVGVSRYVADYMRRCGGLEAVHVPISLMDAGPWPALGRLDNEFVTLVNPCAVKGISIFLELARRMPGVAFAAVPTWGTNQRDRDALRACANVRLLDPVDQIGELLARTRVVLVPSLWAEARSRIVVEAMLHGVPVLASAVGGIPEAMLGVDYLLPVRPIERYQPSMDENMVPVAEVPEQDAGPWEQVLAGLLSDPERYRRLSVEARRAALAYAESLSVAPFEALLEETLRKPKRAPPALSALENLSPDKRRLLAVRLQTRSAGTWFGAVDRAAPLRLFCFPHAGGSALSFGGWGQALGPAVAVCPARLPGREGRAAEAPPGDMAALVAALEEAIRPHLARPFAFFGHSMGAAVAFELARALRRKGHPAPRALLVSSARAPRFRRGHVPPPDPTPPAFLEELRRLDGMPAEVLDDEALLRAILPALTADAALYRRYVYTEEAPLNCPIHAYGGAADPHVRREHLEAWAAETTAAFHLALFDGGHFYLHGARAQFLETVRRDCS